MGVQVATDGSYSRISGMAGWAWVTCAGEQASGVEHPPTTNQRAEMAAVLHALLHWRRQREDIEIISDSAYVVNGINDQWHEKWVRNGWRNSAGKPVANRDLWEEIIDLVCSWPKPYVVKFTHVRGHQGHPLNEMADTLATQARKRVQ